MEAAATGIIHFLVHAIIPVAFLAVCAGVATIASALLALRNAPESVPGQGSLSTTSAYISEKIGVGLCAVISVLGLVAAVQMFRYRHTTPAYPPLGVLFTVSLLILVAPALLWKTRARSLSEGVATIGVAVTSVVSGFSIGCLFVPLALLMTWVCLRHVFDDLVRARRGPPIAV